MNFNQKRLLGFDGVFFALCQWTCAVVDKVVYFLWFIYWAIMKLPKSIKMYLNPVCYIIFCPLRKEYYHKIVYSSTCRKV